MISFICSFCISCCIYALVHSAKMRLQLIDSHLLICCSSIITITPQLSLITYPYQDLETLHPSKNSEYKNESSLSLMTLMVSVPIQTCTTLTKCYDFRTFTICQIQWKFTVCNNTYLFDF